MGSVVPFGADVCENDGKYDNNRSTRLRHGHCEGDEMPMTFRGVRGNIDTHRSPG